VVKHAVISIEDSRITNGLLIPPSDECSAIDHQVGFTNAMNACEFHLRERGSLENLLLPGLGALRRLWLLRREEGHARKLKECSLNENLLVPGAWYMDRPLCPLYWSIRAILCIRYVECIAYYLIWVVPSVRGNS